MDGRNRLLTEWGQFIVGAASQGALTGKPCPISKIEGVAGPRAGALEILAGLDTGKLLRAFTKNDAATLRQFVPWQFTGDPQVYMSSRFLRIEAGWPDGLAETMIRLTDLGKHPKNGGRWVTGKNEMGRTVIAGLNDKTPHYLVSGATGSGKSVALRSAVLQLARDPDNALVLADGKYGESLSQVAHLKGVVGPVATDGPAARAALGWACQQMRERYETGTHEGRIVIIVDEFQEFRDDPAFVGLVRKLAEQGRAAGVHLIMSTQHPTVSAFGDPSVRRNLTGKLALRVDDADASRVAVGSNLPRADFLLGQGDAYAVGPGSCHRVQMAYTDNADFDRANGGRWEFDAWPEYDAAEVGQDLPGRKPGGWSYTGEELAVGLVSASEGEGRPALVKRLEAADLGRPGSDRAARLLRLGRDAHGWLEENEFYLIGGNE